MNINEILAQIDALHEEMLDTSGNTSGMFINKITVHWPAISTELKRLQAQNDYMFAALELTEGRLKDKEATIEKARTYLRFGTGKLNSAEDMRYYIGEALAALDGLASNAEDGWISVKDRLPEYGVEVETLFQYARSVSGPFIAKNTFHEWTDSDGTKRPGWSYTPGNPTHWRYAPAWPAAPKGGE